MSIVPDNASGAWEWNKGITIRRDGKVGIGNSSPAYKLDVAGDAKVSGILRVGNYFKCGEAENLFRRT